MEELGGTLDSLELAGPRFGRIEDTYTTREGVSTLIISRLPSPYSLILRSVLNFNFKVYFLNI